VLAVMIVIFVLGFFLDTFEIIFIVVPITAPALIKLGVDPIWLGVMIGVNLQASFLTPPFGFALFYLRGVASTLVRTVDIYKGVVPFVALQLVGITLVALAPGMATSLPARLYAPGDAAVDRARRRVPPQPPDSPAADDFSDLLEEPVPGRNPPRPGLAAGKGRVLEQLERCLNGVHGTVRRCWVLLDQERLHALHSLSQCCNQTSPPIPHNTST
jgi:hypothetical protein